MSSHQSGEAHVPEQSEPRLRALGGALTTALIGDVLDAMGRRHQFLPPAVRPLRPDDRLVGRAMPLLESPAFDGVKPFGLMFDAIDDLRAGEIYLATGAPLPCAMWGELMTALAQRRGSAGAVLDGYIRDTRGILQTDFPVFSRGSYAQDQRVRGRVTDYRVTVEIGNVVIEPGDYLVGDIDGVVTVPAALVDEVVERALEKQSIERQVREDIMSGMSAADTFRKHDVL